MKNILWDRLAESKKVSFLFSYNKNSKFSSPTFVYLWNFFCPASIKLYIFIRKEGMSISVQFSL
jgi:hypothetical protein